MQKITKKQYNNQKIELLERTSQTESKLTATENQIDDPNFVTLTDSEKILINSNWKRLYDKLYDLKQELQALDSEWSRRNWTYSDYVQSNLIANNID